MSRSAIRSAAILFAVILASAAWGAAPLPLSLQKEQKPESGKEKEKKEKEKPPGSKPGEEQPAPLFGGKVTLKSSRRTKDQATLGFNGIDPNGQVQKKFLASAVGGSDLEKAHALAASRVDPKELEAFAKEGNLKTGEQPSSPSSAAKPVSR